MYRPTYVDIDLGKVEKNFLWLQSFSPSFLCPMVKANAYGHGDIALAKTLEKSGCQHLGVGLVEEGVALRQGGVKSQILVYGFSGQEAFQEIVAQKLVPVVSSWDQFELLERHQNQTLSFHIKFNTGMNRLGFSPNEATKVKERIEQSPHLKLEGVCTHFLQGEDLYSPGKSFSNEQLEKFDIIVSLFKDNSVFFHAYNSAAIAAVQLKKRPLQYGCRPGLLVYGVDPIKGESIKPLISPVMQFKSKIVAVHRVKSGEVVSYGGVWQANRESTIGIVPAGYADGVARSLSNRGEVLVAGARVPLIGNVCMDYIMVDLTELKHQPDNLLNAEVVFFGHQGEEYLSVEKVAEAAGRVSYEILTGISERVPRVYGESR